MTDHLQALAANVKRLREVHGLSLAQLSDRCGVAKATLFKVEQARTNPTLETMVAIADTFGVPFADLVGVPDRAIVEVVRPGEGQNISDNASDGSILRSQVIGAGTLEVHSQRFHSGVSEVSPSHGTGAREHVLVRTGSITLGPVGYEVTVTAGDYVTYPADRPHRWQAVDGDAELWIVHTYPGGTAHIEI
ncbi:helix-turn-helix domain-containing protein [Nocardia sp. NPDC059239]|uniref:helix-turn-helix domain-containing protein n=1 Tax=unclassified Nocardia TaxID=2637762 RepID=UPI0036A35067